jgi:hypothetical protein
MEPRTIIRDVEKVTTPPLGRGDRFAGYAVIGLTFRSGHVLAMRRFPASSVGASYTSVWHRNPSGIWTFYSTVPPEQGCSRYFGAGVQQNVVGPIDLDWTGPAALRLHIGEVLHWEMTLSESLLSRLMNSALRFVPETWWQTAAPLKLMGCAARMLLGTGKMNLSGETPNGQQFIANPQCIWLIDSSRAEVNGIDLGTLGPLNEQARLNEFLIPQRGLFAVARSFLDSRS